MIEAVEGIIISELEYGETSKILNVLTPNLGVIGIMAKGSRSLKSQLRSVTNKLTYGKFYIKYNENKLSILNSVDIINNLRNTKTDIERISYVSYLVELASQVIKNSGINEEVYQLLIDSILKIENGFDPLVITNILELKYLDYLGVMPVLDCCAVCGNTRSIATLSSYKGGYLCNNCLKGEKIVTDKTIKLIRMFYYVDIKKIEKLDISLQSKMEINSFLNDYYDRYTGLYLKTKAFINNLKKIA
ncbi:MAG TPA: DNA repair protein RecO [Bacilli bacterium]|nr:DNA repair protein RecO [Bacilli bacterium]